MAFSKEAVDADAYNAADAPEPCGRDAIDAVFIFLDLLELDAKRVAELHLRESLELPPAFDGAPNGDIVLGRLPVHAALRIMPLGLPAALTAAMRISMPRCRRGSRRGVTPHLSASSMPIPSLALHDAQAINVNSQNLCLSAER
jgi:hypothetical protein